MVSSLGRKLPGLPSSYCLNLQALPHWHHLNVQKDVCHLPQEPQALCMCTGPMVDQDV